VLGVDMAVMVEEAKTDNTVEMVSMEQMRHAAIEGR
jgi:hypothetical protein